MQNRSQNKDPTFSVKSRSTWEVVRRVAVFLKPYKPMAAATIGCALLSLGFALAYPKLTQFVVDDVIGGRRLDWLAPAMAGLIPAFFLPDFGDSPPIRIHN